jgi:TRAP-type C4-dicarboxylate transport system permease small subunit
MNPFLLAIKQKLIVFEKLLAAFCLLLLLLLSLSQVVMRNLFELGFAELDTLTRHLVLFVTFMGAALISEGNKHIKIDCVTATISERSKQKLKRPLYFISALVCSIFSWYAIVFWLDEKNYAPASEQFALYLALILPAGFIILSLHFLLLSLIRDDNIQSPEADDTLIDTLAKQSGPSPDSEQRL